MTTNTIAKLLLVATAALCLSACATYSSTNATESEPDAGERPSNEQAEKAVKEYLRSTLKDPDSIKNFEMTSEPSKTTWYRGLLNGGGHAAGWIVCYKYNAKNSYGGYVGLKNESIVLTRNGEYVTQMLRVNWPLVTYRC